MMIMDEEKIWLGIAEEAYRAYGIVTDFKNYQGLPMPTFDELSKTIKQAWVTACQQAVDSYDESFNEGIEG